MAQKECRTCRTLKDLAAFSKDARSRDGRQSKCKECFSAYMKARLASRGEEINARRAASRAARTDAEREAWKQYMREYYQANPERFVRTDPDKIAAHRDRVWRRNQDAEVREAKRASQRAAYAANPEPWKAGAMRRRARLRGATVALVTERDWRRIVARQGGCCHYCGARTELTRDHLIPLARGGAHSVGNIVGACITCNTRKGTKTRSEFLAWLHRMAPAA